MVHRKPEINLHAIALERIGNMHRMALATVNSNTDLSREYISLMEKISFRLDITLPANIKRSYCKKCKKPYTSSDTVRLKKGLVEIRCSSCGNVRRIPYGISH
ncbi:MAG: ribonuclease P protein component 4 [Thermoplasmataceae archaeon]